MITRSSLGDAYPIDKLGNVVEFLDNMRRPVTESERISGPYPYYGANGIQGTINDFIFDEPLVLLAEDGGHFDNPDRGIAYRVSGRTWVNNHAHVLRPRRNIDINYLCRVLENYDVKPFVTGTTRGKLTKGGASEIPIPLPPLPEQRRIAAVLDKADALRAKRRETLAQLDDLTQSIFIEMFGDPVANPKGWPITKVASFLLDVTNGLTRRRSEVEDGEHIVLRLRDIRSESIDFSTPNRITLNEKEKAKYQVSPGELLFIRVNGNPEYVGRCALFEGHPEQVFFNDHVMRVRLKAGLTGGYLSHFLNRPEGKKEIAKHRKTSARQHTINQDGLGAIALPLPDESLQNQFLDRVFALRKMASVQIDALDKLGALFTSLQHRAFRGEL